MERYQTTCTRYTQYTVDIHPSLDYPINNQTCEALSHNREPCLSIYKFFNVIFVYTYLLTCKKTKQKTKKTKKNLVRNFISAAKP